MNKKQYTEVLKKAQKQHADEQLLNLDEISKATIALIESNPSKEEFADLIRGVVLSAEATWYIMTYNNCDNCINHLPIS